ncbi:hypothetical protein BGW80DRAFT_1462775 [Lactifluus volemus]|nr:hypothetical protein BGW80DRAFT_1462775 [Lactifluus volemus]
MARPTLPTIATAPIPPSGPSQIRFLRALTCLFIIPPPLSFDPALFFLTSLQPHTSDEAAANLASLKFSQSNRGPDPREPSRVITTTTTTTFSMTRDMAKAMSQHFMDARLIENAADPSSNLFKDRGVYVLTPKGLHVLERFISHNGINGDHLSRIIVSQSVITALFRRFVGRQANYPPPTSQNLDPTAAYHERAKGIQPMDVSDRLSTARSQAAGHRSCFAALAALEWLCDFTSVVGRKEAAEMAAQFVRFGLIALVSDKRKNNDSAIIFTVRGSAPGGSSPVSHTGDFRCTAKAIYRITDEGIRTARWDTTRTASSRDSPSSSTANLSTAEHTSIEVEGTPKLLSSSDAKIHRRISLAEKLNASYIEETIHGTCPPPCHQRRHARQGGKCLQQNLARASALNAP